MNKSIKSDRGVPQVFNRFGANEGDQINAKFNRLIDIMSKFEKKLDPETFFKICRGVYEGGIRNDFGYKEFSDDALQLLRDLSGVSDGAATIYFNCSPQFAKILAISFMCLKGEAAFDKTTRKLDDKAFKSWLSILSKKDYGTYGLVRISNQALEDITIDKDGIVTFGKDYDGKLNINAKFITVTYDNGDKYVGGWLNDKPHGEEGTMIYKEDNGKRIYTGAWQCGDAHGQGTVEQITYNRTDYKGTSRYGTDDTHKYTYTYEGGFQNGQPHGKGTMKHCKVYNTGHTYTYTYEGWFQNGQPHGEGTLTDRTSGTYEGYFINGKRNGSGTQTFVGGNTYTGEWKNDRQHGEGIRENKDGKYDGRFKDGMRDGTGTYIPLGGTAVKQTWKDGKQIS